MRFLARWYHVTKMLSLLVWRPCLSGMGRLSLTTAYRVAVILAPDVTRSRHEPR